MEKIKTELLKQSTTLTTFLESNVYKGLTPLEKEIVIAVNHTPIKEFEDKYLTNLLLALIATTHLQSGQFLTGEKKQIVDLTVDELSKDFKNYNGNLSFPEINIAFKNGLKGEYGEYFGLNNKTYFQWVNAYAYGEKRLRVKKMLSDAKEKQNIKPEITEEEKEQILLNGALNCFEHYKNFFIILETGAITYNFLNDKGLITFTKEVKSEIMSKCQKRLIALEKSKQLDLANVRNAKHIKSAIIELENGNTPAIILESKKEALKMFFDNLIEMGQDLKELITS